MNKRSVAAKKGWATRREREEFRKSPLGQAIINLHGFSNEAIAQLRIEAARDFEYNMGGDLIGATLNIKRPGRFKPTSSTGEPISR